MSINEEFGKKALRVLGLAYKSLNEGFNEEDMEKDYLFICINFVSLFFEFYFRRLFYYS